MKRISYTGVLTVLLLLYVSSLWANSSLQYSLSKEKIEKARFVDHEDGTYSVMIGLKEPYKEEFAKLTGRNIGKVLQIIFQGQIVVETIIRDEISSGIIDSKWKSAEDAQRFMDTLLHYQNDALNRLRQKGSGTQKPPRQEGRGLHIM